MNRRYGRHDGGDRPVAELVATGVVIQSSQDFLDIMGELWADGVNDLIAHEGNLDRAFFNLATGLADAGGG